MTPLRKRAAKSGKRREVDRIEQTIEGALKPGSFISYKATWSFVENAQGVSATIEELMGRLEAGIRRATDEALEDLGHYCAEPLAGRLERSHPDLAARVYQALGMRIVKAGKSEYYGAALDHLESAKECYARANLVGEWEMLVAEVRLMHHRKRGFMPGFEDIVSGAPKEEEACFLERAWARWPGKAEEE